MHHTIDNSLGWVDYTAIFAVLIIPGFISLYFGLMTPKSKKLGEKRHMGFFPALMSLMASAISAMSMIGMPNEAYLNGIIFVAYIMIGRPITVLLNNYIFMPVLYNLQIESAYEYFELRFDGRTRKLASLIYITTQIFYCAIAAYPAAQIISHFVSQLSVFAITQGLMIFCAALTLIGGFKGVVWTDTFQAIFIWIFLILVVSLAIIQGGGLINIYNVAKETGRLEAIIMDFDPTLRMTFWSGVFGMTTMYVTYSVINPSSFQRYSLLKSERTARNVTIANEIQLALINLLQNLCGLGMYAAFHGCDPKLAGIVDNYLNNLVLVISKGSNVITGVKGLFIAGILSGSLSTMSTNLNTAATLMYTEFVKAWTFASKMTETAWIRWLSCLAGVLSMVFVPLVEGTNSIMEVFQMFIGGTSGLSVGLYVLGMICVNANSRGTFWGGACSLGLMSTISVSSRLYASDWKGSPNKPLSTSGCSFNITTINTSPRLPIDHLSTVPWLFRITPHYYPFIGASLTVTLGLIVSRFTTGLQEDRSKLKKELFCPLVRDMFKDKFYQEVSQNENSEKLGIGVTFASHE